MESSRTLNVRIHDPRRALFVGFVLAQTFLSGCGATIFGARARLIESSSRDSEQEVTATPLYRQMLPKLTSVAVRAPDQCASQTASEATGRAERKREVLSTNCGVEMAEIERALTRVGYAVISWRDLAGLVSIEKMTHQAAARKLGANVLFQVNSLEKVVLHVAADARWERQFFLSNEQGANLGPFEVSEHDLLQLRFLLGQREASVSGNVRLGAMLDVNAVSVESGQTLWFYRWQKAQARPSSDNTILMLFARDGDQIQPTSPTRANEQASSTVAVTGEVQAVSSGARPASEQDKVYFELLREVTKDFAERFKSGKEGK